MTAEELLKEARKPDKRYIPGPVMWQRCVFNATETIRELRDAYASAPPEIWEESDQGEGHQAKLEILNNALRELEKLEF